MDIKELKNHCEPFQRIAMMLKAYKELLSNTNQNEMKLFDNIKRNYNHQQVFNDFLHIKIIHIDADNDKIKSHDHLEDESKEKYIDVVKHICDYFEKDLELKCNTFSDNEKNETMAINCRAIGRHYLHRVYDNNEKTLSDEEKAFRTECDKIHIFFLHSTVKYGIKYNQTNVDEDTQIDEMNRYNEGRVYLKRLMLSYNTHDDEEKKSNSITTEVNRSGKLYIGRKEDDKWWNHIQPNDKKQEEEE
eukprot:221812_1